MQPKSFNTVLLEGFLYTVIGAFTPVIAVLQSDVVLDKRKIVSLGIVASVAGATALKAFLSTSVSSKSPVAHRHGGVVPPAAPPPTS